MEPIYHFVRTRAGEYHSGIPARDLTKADLKDMTDEQRATIEASPLYRKIEPPAEQAQQAARPPSTARTAGGKA